MLVATIPFTLGPAGAAGGAVDWMGTGSAVQWTAQFEASAGSLAAPRPSVRLVSALVLGISALLGALIGGTASLWCGSSAVTVLYDHQLVLGHCAGLNIHGTFTLRGDIMLSLSGYAMTVSWLQRRRSVKTDESAEDARSLTLVAQAARVSYEKTLRYGECADGNLYGCSCQ